MLLSKGQEEYCNIQIRNVEEQLKSGKWDRETRVENFNEDISIKGISET